MTATRPPERRQLTVMLCDVVGWTALSQRVDAEELADVVRAYRRRCTEAVERHGGLVAQYVGDAVLAYFGYPHANENDAERAIRAALEIAGPAPGPSRPDGGLDVHIGIATGIVVVGDLLGDGLRLAHGDANPQGPADVSAVGSALNLAARLQSLAGPGEVVIADRTRRLAHGIFELRDLGRHALKGFDEPVHAWAAVRERRVRSRFHARRADELTPLANRRAELAALRAHWAAACTGRGKAVLLAGEPGIGKSRLADELSRRIVEPGTARVWYYCSAHEQQTPLAPLVRYLPFAAGFADDDDDDAKLDKLAAFLPAGASGEADALPLIAALLALRHEHRHPLPPMSPQRRRQRLFAALVGLLERVASRRPVLLVVEDLHWIDASSEELLDSIVERLPRLPVLALLTARPAYRPRWEGTAQAVRLALAPLDRADSVAMIESLRGDRDIPARSVALIAERADGLPLFIEDLMHEMMEAADRGAAGEPAPRGASDPSRDVPATLSDALMARLDRLGAARWVAQVGAAIGREFGCDLLERAAGLARDELQTLLGRLVDAGLVTPRAAAPVPTYAFRHALVRDAAYASLLRKDRLALHARIVLALTGHFPEAARRQPEVLAYHFEAAGDAENAARFLIDAARLSASRSGFVEAIGQLQHALQLLSSHPDRAVRAQLELRAYRTLGGIYAEHRGFSSAECGAAYDAALALCHELGGPPEIFAVLSGVGAFEITRANFARCRALAEECLQRAAEQDARTPFVMGHLLLGGTLFLTAELGPARSHLEEALRLYDEDRSAARSRQVLYVQDQKSTGLAYLGLALAAMGDVEGAARAGRAGLAHSRSLGGPHTVNYSLCYLAALHHFLRETGAALERANESLELAREQGFRTWIGISQTLRGVSLVGAGAIPEGLREIRDGIAAHEGMEAVTYMPFALSLLATGLGAAGRWDEALPALDQALETADRTGERFYAAELHRQRGECLAAAGQRSQGVDALRHALLVARAQGARLFELRSAVSLCRLVGDAARMDALRDDLAPACAHFSDSADTPDLREARALLGCGPGTPATG